MFPGRCQALLSVSLPNCLATVAPIAAPAAVPMGPAMEPITAPTAAPAAGVLSARGTLIVATFRLADLRAGARRAAAFFATFFAALLTVFFTALALRATFFT